MSMIWINREYDYWHVLVFKGGNIIYYETDIFLDNDSSDDIIMRLCNKEEERSWGHRVINGSSNCDVEIMGRYMEFIRGMEEEGEGVVEYGDVVRFRAKGG